MGNCGTLVKVYLLNVFGIAFNALSLEFSSRSCFTLLVFSSIKPENVFKAQYLTQLK